MAGSGHTFQPEFLVVADAGATQHATGQLGADVSYSGAVVTYRGSWSP